VSRFSPYRLLADLFSHLPAAARSWPRFLRFAAALGILVICIDLNSTHVRGVVQGLVHSWSSAQAAHELAEIAAALDAEYASHSRYPDASDFEAFVRRWVKGKQRDPAHDRWGMPVRYRHEGTRFELLSCGPDVECGTRDDIRRQGGF
jgi:hypothetical protein